MAKGGKFAALAQFRQEQHVDDEAPPAADQPTAPVEAPPAEAAMVQVEAPESATAEPVSMADPVPLATDDDEPADVRLPVRQPREPVAKVARPRGRPPGKRSDPDWKLFSHFLKRSTQRQATALLFEQDSSRDLSDVLQSLLEKWVARERAKI